MEIHGVCFRALTVGTGRIPIVEEEFSSVGFSGYIYRLSMSW